MRSTDENKCGMQCIRTNSERICVKPEKGQCPRCEQLVGEALVRIRQLEQRLAQAEREKNALLFDSNGKCSACKNMDEAICFKCVHANWDEEAAGDYWQWRGVCEENSK